MKQYSILVLLLFILTSCFTKQKEREFNLNDSAATKNVKQQKDELYLNYLAAIQNESTFQYFLVVNVKNLKTGITREYCTKGNFLKGALHKEYNLKYNEAGLLKVYTLALKNKERYFEFKKGKALKNINGWPYTMDELAALEKTVNFDSLATQIKTTGKWSKAIFDDKTMLMYAHALFNRGILTGENNCFGGTLIYVDRNK